MLKKLPLFISTIVGLFIYNNDLKSQIVAPDAFIKGNFVEVGVSGPGGFEGATAAAPAGMHFRGGFGLSGFVADPLFSGWTNYNGDFFTPGSPENGWGIHVGNTSASPDFHNNSNYRVDIPGAITTYSAYLNCRNVFWDGAITSGTTAIGVNINYYLDISKVYYTTIVTLKNNSVANIPMLYYYRNVDPDNNQPVHGDFTTMNVIENQPGTGCNLACVSASQAAMGGGGSSYMAFAGLDPEFRVTTGGFSERNGYEIWNGGLSSYSTPYIKTVGSSNFADEAISIAYRIQNLLPGTTRSFKFVTILKSADKNAAVNSLFYLSYPGSTTSAPVACSSIITPPDTVKTCGPTKVEITGPGLSGYSWSWSPTIYLSSSTTFSTYVNPAVTTVYTITGVPTTTCVSGSLVYTIVAVPKIFPLTITPATTYCPGSPINLTASGAGVGGSYAWYGPSGFTSSLQSPSIASASLANAGTYSAVATTSAGCTNTITTTVSVLSITSSFSIPSPIQCLTGNSFNFNNTGTAGGTHSYVFTPSTGSPGTGSIPNYSGSFTLPGTYTVTHTVLLSGCTSSTTGTVTVNPMPSATLSFTNPSCGSSNGIVVINNTSSVGQTITSFASTLGSVLGQTITGLSGGSPVISLTNNFGCTFTVGVTLTPSSGPSAITLVPANASCGFSNGSIAFSGVVGGTPAYSYALNGGLYTATSPITGLAAGVYSVSVKDAGGCIFTATTSILSTSGPTAIAGSTVATSCASNNGSYNVSSVTGGFAAYSYSVDAVATSALTTGLAAGNHTITVKDANGCIFSTTFIIPTTAGPTSATVLSSNASCGVANGTSTVSAVVGGIPTYQYSFDGGTFGFATTTSGLSAGIHNVTIRDANSCTTTVTYNVLNSGSPTAVITGVANVSCFGLSNGSFTVTGSGGSGAPFTYSLTSPFIVNGTGYFSGLPAGIYNVTLKDVAGCSSTASLTINQPPVLSSTLSSIAVKCFGTNTGTINILSSGGTSPYLYQLNGGAFQSSSSFTSVGAGIYIITVKDANLCLSTQTISVSQPPALSVSLIANDANCSSANGFITSTVTGGTPIYTYAWTGGGGFASVTNSLVAGTYSLNVTDANGCIFSTFATIGSAPGGTAVITSSSNVSCNGASNGSLTVTPSGGTGPFRYSWSPGGFGTASISGLAPGSYTCIVTDFYGCRSTVIGTITEPSVLNVLMGSNSAKCYGTSSGTVSASGSGGTTPYTYSWPALSSTLSTVSGVAAGTYSCTLTDASGCLITGGVTVTQPSSISLTSSVTPANCGLSNGFTSITASGGTPAYTYTWSTGSTASFITGVAAGTYTVLVKDANNCTQTLSSTIPNLSGPSISISSQTNISCYSGSNGVATALASAGTGTYTYAWSNGNVTPTASGLSAGVYTVSVTDVMGCLASTMVTITQPSILTVSITSTNPKCFGAMDGSGVAAVFGGSPGYIYSWTGGGGSSSLSNPLGAGNYGLSVTDSKGCIATASMALVNPLAMSSSLTFTNVTCFGLCNAVAVGSATNAVGVVSYYWTGGSSPISNQVASGLCAGTYTMLATDQNNCTSNSIVSITEPALLTAVIATTGSVTCNGGTNGYASVTPAGGTPTYSYTWSGAASSAGNSSNAGTLPAGIYTVTVSDTKGCLATAVASILQPSALSTTLSTTNAKCNGVCDGTANIAFSGGAGTTTFLWEPSLQSGNFVSSLCAGNQTVTITSNGACQTKLTFTLTQPVALTNSITSNNSNCGLSNGNTCATVAGGTAPLAYLWSNGVTTLCNNFVRAGAYTFTVTDVNLCKSVGSGLVNDIAGPVVSILSFSNVSCFAGTNGAATTTITGGVPSYSISWSGNPATTQNVSNFTAGLQNITVIDAAGCIGTASVNITQPTSLVSAIPSYTNVTCNGLSNGGATMLVNGGTPGYTYSWTPSGQISNILTGVGANTYTCIVKDANNCASSQVITINQPAPLIMAASSFSNVSCFGGNNGQIFTSVTGGNPGYTYSWTPTQPNSGVLGGLTSGAYALTVTDTKSCTISSSFNILEPSMLISSYVSIPSKCGIANGSATISVGGGTPGYTINWNTAPAQTGVTAINMATGTWLGVITDSHGCSITQTVNVADAPSPIITGFTTTQPLCYGMSSGSITVNYSGGTSPYSVAWSNPISIVASGLTGLSHSVTGVASGAYTATVTDNYGCSVAMPVNLTQPGMLIETVSSNTNICYGQNTQIYVQGVSGTGPYTYSWTPGTIVGAGPHTVNPLIMTSYSVVTTDANGCVTSPKVITINVSPQLLIGAASYTRCDGDNQLLNPTITSPGNGGPYTYNWNTGSIAPAISVMASLPTSPTNYTVMISDGCSLPASAIFTLNVNPRPVISFTSNVLSGCAPLPVYLSATSDAPSSIFNWSYGENLNFIANPHVIILSDSGKYTISLSVTNTLTGCKSSETKVDYIEVFPQPTASFYPNLYTTSIVNPTIDFTNTSSHAIGYDWLFGDPAALGGSNTSILINPSHTYGFVGTYGIYLIATSAKGCKDTASVIIDVTADFALYVPNAFTPNHNGLNDMFQPVGVGIDVENYQMDIFDRWGELIFSTNNFKKGWDGSVKGHKLAEQGVYVYKITAYDMDGNVHPYVGHVTVLRTN